MRSSFSCGWNRRVAPVLLAVFVLNVWAFAQDLPAAKPESRRAFVRATGADLHCRTARHR